MELRNIELTDLVVLDAGGQGKVYTCYMTSSEDLQPVKVVAKDLTDNLEEELMLKDLNHDNVIKFYGTTRIDVPYLILEYIDGGNLEINIANRYMTLKSNILQKIKGMIDAINYIHSKQILHLDLHPKNIMVKSVVPCCHCFKITDFGLSKRENHALPSRNPKGRPGFMSPEHITGEQITKDADIWALGCILWYIWTKEEPFNFTDGMAKQYKVGLKLHPDIPNDWPVVIQNILFDCWDRRCNAGELLRLFKNLIKNKDAEIELKRIMPLNFETRFIQIKSDRIVPAIIWNSPDKNIIFSKYNFIGNELIKRFEGNICRRKFEKVKSVGDLLKFLNENGYIVNLHELRNKVIYSTEMISKLTDVLDNYGSHWMRVARSIGMPDVYIDRIKNEPSCDILNEIMDFWIEHPSIYPFELKALDEILLNHHIKIE